MQISPFYIKMHIYIPLRTQKSQGLYWTYSINILISMIRIMDFQLRVHGI